MAGLGPIGGGVKVNDKMDKAYPLCKLISLWKDYSTMWSDLPIRYMLMRGYVAS